jgi:predicted CXXCH cytochrome family protein
MSFGSEKLSLYIDPSVLANSVHGNKLLCSDCHASITTFPHSNVNVTSLRDYSVAQYELCKQCHYANYTKSLDSVHYKVLEQGMTAAPLCTDCHGAHNVTKPDQPRSKISTTCSQCHQDINNQYVQSVHGKALIEDNNFDVPVCTDCHPSHTIEDPTTAAFRNQSVDLCSSCHANATLMKKYGISTNVVQSYLQDFHGSTVTLMSQEGKDIWVKTAVCTDCHGVHDIKKVTDSNSSVIKANLVVTCAKCHPGISTSFPGAWLSHYEPSIHQAPLVFATQWFYKIMIPFIIVGLSAHILLDIWRALTNR